MNKLSDLHIHTLVSDGNNTPGQMLISAQEAGVGKLSFTDHDALGAYRHFGDIFAQAKDLGIELISGIEMDTEHQGKELHLLGYGFDLNDGPLNRHLDLTQRLRKERVLLQIAIINRFFGRQIIKPAQVLIHGRDTLMKPQLVHALLGHGLFSEYRAAAYWLSQNAQVPVVVTKLPLPTAISLLRSAGGKAVLAHPGYLIREMGVPLAPLLKELVPLGLSGLEVDYPYRGTSHSFPDPASEQAMIRELRSLAKHFKLKETRGSDAHSVDALKSFALSSIGEKLKKVL